MAKQTINVGTVPNDGTGDTLNASFTKCNANFTELYNTDILLATIASPVFTGDPRAPTPATADNDTSIATTAYVQANLVNYQPVDADLTAIAALAGTNTIYYRSAANTWTNVSIGAGLTFASGTLAATATPAHGSVILEWISSTQIRLSPFGGNSIKVAGAAKSITGLGVTAANTGIRVNGAAGQNLVADTTYLVCLFDASGVLTLDFLTTLTHAKDTTAGNEGVEIKSGDNTRTVVGMIRTNASAQFVDSATQRFLRSWFNPKTTRLFNTTPGYSGAPFAAFSDIGSPSHVEWVNFTDEAVEVSMAGGAYSDFITLVSTGVGLDGAAATAYCVFTSVAGGYELPIAARSVFAPSEGYHYAALMGFIGDNVTVNWAGNITLTGTVCR